MRFFSRKIAAIITSTLLFALLPGCNEPLEGQLYEHPAYSSFHDIPGVTDDEIKSIEALKGQFNQLVFGSTPSTEAFYGESGEITGFITLFCDWLTELFDIPFIPSLYEWGDLLTALEEHEVDFTSELTATPERRKVYFMTDTVAERSVKLMRISGSAPLPEIAAWRPLHYVFLEDTTTFGEVSALEKFAFEYTFVNDYENAYNLLKSGEADAFFDEGPAEAAFDVYGDVIADDFFPMIYSPVSLTTKNPALAPIISVVQKALLHGGIRFLTGLYNQGNLDYVKHKLFNQLSEDEKEYIKSNPTVSFVAEYDNYPVSFYNTHEGQWQGIAFDVLRDVEELTGLEFKIINDRGTQWSQLIRMLEYGEASMISELIRSDDREGRFLWPKTAIMSDNYALLSKSTQHNISVNEILYTKIGLTRDTAHAAMFRSWFPNHMNTFEYETIDLTFNALERDEIDMAMSSQNQLLILTNYHELAGYKANFVFDRSFDSSFGFNKNETVLCSIIDKALPLIDLKGTAGQWVRRTYDYREKLVSSRLPWLLGASALLLCVLILLFIMFQRNRHEGRRLESLVRKRTAEVAKQNTLMHIVNEAATLLLGSDTDDHSTVMIRGMEMLGRGVDVDRVSVWQNHRLGDGKLYYKVVCQWASEGLPPLDTDSYFSYEDFVPSWEGLFSKGESVNATVDSLNEPEKSVLSAFAMKSILAVPIFLKGDLWGYVSFDDYRNRRVFSEVKEHIIRSWGLLIVGALQRQEIALNMQKTQRDLENALEDAKAASRAKSDFLANMSHEIRTPMNAIIGMTSIGNSATDNEKKDYCFTKIDDASKHLLGVINDILDMSKIEANKFDLSPAEFSFEKMLKSVVNVVNFRVDQKKQKFTVHIGDTIPQFLIADDQRLAQVITNLTSNAVKFTHEGGIITLDSQLEEEKDGLCTIQISVSDNGIGISPEQQDRLFQSFQQAETSTSRKFGGTGLGLSISKSIVEMMGGKIWVTSEPGKGAVFSFTIQAMRGKGKKQGLDDRDVNFAGTSILAVDDDPDVLELFRQTMKRSGAQCDTALSAEDALELVNEKGLHNICFVDWKLPGINGMALTRALKAKPGYDETHVVMITAADWSALEEEGKESGVEKFLSKPLFSSSITDTVKELLFQDRQADHEQADDKQAENPVLEGRFAGRCILLAEDVEINREIVLALLEPARLSIDCAENGEIAVQMFREAPEKYDMVFMDVQMPKMDGYEATRAIRSLDIPAAKTIPIIAMTANVFREDVEKCLEAGMDSHVGKPLNLDEVMDKLHAFLPES